MTGYSDYQKQARAADAALEAARTKADRELAKCDAKCATWTRNQSRCYHDCAAAHKKARGEAQKRYDSVMKALNKEVGKYRFPVVIITDTNDKDLQRTSKHLKSATYKKAVIRGVANFTELKRELSKDEWVGQLVINLHGNEDGDLLLGTPRETRKDIGELARSWAQAVRMQVSDGVIYETCNIGAAASKVLRFSKLLSNGVAHAWNHYHLLLEIRMPIGAGATEENIRQKLGPRLRYLIPGSPTPQELSQQTGRTHALLLEWFDEVGVERDLPAQPNSKDFKPRSSSTRKRIKSAAEAATYEQRFKSAPVHELEQLAIELHR